jgi:signal transduction histidine kinase
MKYQSFLGLKDLFDKTLGAVEDAVLTVDRKGTITGSNRMFSNMSSLDEKMLFNHSYFESFENDPFDVKKVLQGGNKIVDEKVVFNRNIQYATYPLFDEKNRIAGAIAVLRDVTKLRDFEREREETERLKFLGNLVANFAHEIKNPLNGLSIAVQRLTKEFPSGDEEYNRLTTSIKKEIESLNKILNDFLSLARPRIKEKKEFDLSDIVHDTVNVVYEEAKSRRVEIRDNISKEIKVIGDPDDFKRAVLNIVLNALAAVPDNTGVIDVELKRRKGDILLTIADNGVGMDEEEIERIFTPYFTTKKGGTGLGLYIAQRILKEHRAEIKVTSKKGKGTTFKILLQSM